MPIPFPNQPFLNLGTGRSAHVMPGVEVVSFSAAVAAINAGNVEITPKIPGFIYKPLGFLLICAGNAAGATDVRLSSSASTPVDIATVAVANAQDGDKLNEYDANAVLGAGFNAELASGEGIVIRKTGSALSGTTTISGWVMYQLTRG